MNRHFHSWTRPLRVLREWLSIDSWPPVHRAASSAQPADAPGRTRTAILFTPVSPVPSSAKLSVELVPASCWCSNVRDHVTREQWDQLRRETYRHAQYRCEVCHGEGPEWPVECHEVWHYYDTNRVQTLVRLMALCPACHRTKHIGLAEVNGDLAEARSHLAQINGWTEGETEAYLAHVWQVWEARSAHDWRLDVSWLEHWHIFVQPKR